MRLPDLVAPEATSDGNNGELGQDDGASDSGGHLLGALDAQTNVAVVVSDSCNYNGLLPMVNMIGKD